ncbi:MAG TPA: methyltransferase domain-containing protein [Candidatus Acidoferrales bacterium]
MGLCDNERVNLAYFRRFYSEEIRIAARIASPPLVEALAMVPREKFMGPPPWQIASGESLGNASLGLSDSQWLTTDDPRDLYHNILVQLDATLHANNGQPSALAKWIDALSLKPGERVFHAGCGVGYYTAIMAEIVGPQGGVVAAEVNVGLAARAKENLADYSNIAVHACDAATLDSGECDAMFINAGVTHPHKPWLERLRVGGRMVLPITFTMPGTPSGTGVMLKITREAQGFSAKAISMVAIYSCTSVRDPELGVELKNAVASKALLKISSVRIDAHEKTGSCVAHRADVCLSLDKLA